MANKKLNGMELEYINDALTHWTEFMIAETVKAEDAARAKGKRYIIHPSFWEMTKDQVIMKLKLK